MNRFLLTLGTSLFVASLTGATPDVSNLNNCIKDVRQAEANAPKVLTFDQYKNNYKGLIADLNVALPKLPFVYQEAAVKPLVQFLQNLGESKYIKIFASDPSDDLSATLQEIIPDAALAILSFESNASNGVLAFEEIVSDIYNDFLANEAIASKSGQPITPPNYGIIPPLVKFGNEEYGPYTWPGDATNQILGMKCAVVSLPPSQLKGGLIAWTSLGHETGGHDVMHADKGLLDELANKVYSAILAKLRNKDLATYWANCIDEAASDVLGYLHMGPSQGIGLIGYFRALGNGKLRSVGYLDDPHPIDLLRGYLAASVVKRLNFSDANAWSEVITKETNKDKATLYLVNNYGNYVHFPATFDQAVQSAEIVAEVVMNAKLKSLEGHTLKGIQNWKDADQKIVDEMTLVFKNGGALPAKLRGAGFYASYVLAGATQAALQQGSQVSSIFTQMQNFLVEMHLQNPIWAATPNKAALALLERSYKELKGNAPHKRQSLKPTKAEIALR